MGFVKCYGFNETDWKTRLKESFHFSKGGACTILRKAKTTVDNGADINDSKDRNGNKRYT